jgi:hypothetical protein
MLDEVSAPTLDYPATLQTRGQARETPGNPNSAATVDRVLNDRVKWESGVKIGALVGYPRVDTGS